VGRVSTESDTCSFCAKTAVEVGKLVQGPDDLAVCGECVHLMAEIVADSPPPPGEERSCRLVTEDGTAHEIKHGLHEVVSMLGHNEAALVTFVLADGGRLAVRRGTVRQVLEAPDASKNARGVG